MYVPETRYAARTIPNKLVLKSYPQKNDAEHK